MSYRDDFEALSARHAALETELLAKTRELGAAAQLLADAKRQAMLPVLDNIRVASPCSAQWANMTGDERTRQCGSCQKAVYNLSAMTRAEAEALLVEKEGRLCVRYYQRADGTIMTADCSVGIAKKRKRRIMFAGAAVLAAGAAIAVAHAAQPDDHHEMAGEPVMGDLAAPPSPPPVA